MHDSQFPVMSSVVGKYKYIFSGKREILRQLKLPKAIITNKKTLSLFHIFVLRVVVYMYYSFTVGYMQMFVYNFAYELQVSNIL